MACNISSGRTVDCKDQIGGIKAVYFMNYVALEEDIAVDGATGAVTTIGTQTVYQFDVRPETASLTINVNGSKENGTTFYEQSFDITLHKLTATDEDNLRLLTYGRPQIFVLDNNGQVFLLGAINGCDVNSGQITTGTGFGDMSGYTLSFTGREPRAYYQFAAGTVGAAGYPFDGLTGVVTVTQ